MTEHAGGTLVPCGDTSMVVTDHGDYLWISVLNKSVSDEKLLDDIDGAYEIFTPDRENMKRVCGNGRLLSIPPASAAFIKRPKT